MEEGEFSEARDYIQTLQKVYENENPENTETEYNFSTTTNFSSTEDSQSEYSLKSPKWQPL